MSSDGIQTNVLRVDGGMVENDWVMQYLSDTLQIEVDRPEVIETTALGACFLAGLQVGIFKSLDDLKAKWQLQRKFSPQRSANLMDSRYKGWQQAVSRVRTNE
jgi:glycerol kinase